MTPSIPVRTLGRSGIEVSSITLGTMMFGAWGNTDVQECAAMVDRALAAGITMFDTADIYDVGVSEQILGAALGSRRDGVVLATKCGNPMGEDPAQRGLSSRWVAHACNDSLRRLGVDHIDLFQMHRPDPSTPIEETLTAFDALVQAGKIRAYGTSTFSADEIDALQVAATALGITPPTSEQPPYSILARGIEESVLPMCASASIGVVVWAPLNGGWLTGKYQGGADSSSRAVRQGEHFDHRDADARATKLDLVAQLGAVAAEAGLSLVQLALAFVFDDPTVTSAIIGPRTLPQLDELLAAGTPVLAAGVRDAIDAIVAPATNVNPADAA